MSSRRDSWFGNDAPDAARLAASKRAASIKVTAVYDGEDGRDDEGEWVDVSDAVDIAKSSEAQGIHARTRVGGTYSQDDAFFCHEGPKAAAFAASADSDVQPETNGGCKPDPRPLNSITTPQESNGASQASQEPTDAASLKAQGNSKYSAKLFHAAAALYDEAHQHAPVSPHPPPQSGKSCA